MQRRTVAVLCLVPDSGHVLPLLRLASLLDRQLQCRIVCILPSKFESIVREYGFEYFCLRSELSDFESKLAERISGCSIFYNAFSNYMDLSDCYWSPLREVLSHELESLVGTLCRLKPQFLLCDRHAFPDWYERLASCCGARLIIHGSEGTLRSMRSLFVRTYGLTKRHRWLQELVELAGRSAELWFRGWRQIRYPGRSRSVRAMMNAANKRAALAFVDCGATEPEEIYVTSGLAVLESGICSAQAGVAAIKPVILAPSVEATDGGLPPDLTKWLAQQRPGNVVYVCFGTMVALSDAMMEELISGLVDAGVSVIWSLRTSQRRLVAKHRVSDQFRFEEYVPQVALLASELVGCFVTHGGAGSTQEAVVCGKPILCIPFMWDQPYNGSLVASLGVARVLSKRQISRRRVSKEITELLNNPTYAQSARRLAGEVRELQRSEQQLASIRGIIERRVL